MVSNGRRRSLRSVTTLRSTNTGNPVGTENHELLVPSKTLVNIVPYQRRALLLLIMIRMEAGVLRTSCPAKSRKLRCISNIPALQGSDSKQNPEPLLSTR
jgi:hypothetical protein